MIENENRGTLIGYILGAGDFDSTKVDASREAQDERDDPSGNVGVRQTVSLRT